MDTILRQQIDMDAILGYAGMILFWVVLIVVMVFIIGALTNYGSTKDDWDPSKGPPPDYDDREG